MAVQTRPIVALRPENMPSIPTLIYELRHMNSGCTLAKVHIETIKIQPCAAPILEHGWDLIPANSFNP
jgi:hypothetical protein